MKLSFVRPYPYVNSPASETQGIGIRRKPQPRYTACWRVEEDSRLTCRWDVS